MKYFLATSILLLSFSSIAQTLEISGGAGTGAFYFGEEADNSISNGFDHHRSLYIDITYRKENTPNALKLRFQQTAVDIEGLEYRTNRTLDGSIETFSTALMYERLRFNRNINLGYQIGVGFTQEDFVVNKSISATPEQDRFASIILGAVATTRLSDKFRLNLELTGLWTDPLNTLRGSDNWQTGGEDISFILQAGISYKLF
jgi:hypothetical protein